MTLKKSKILTELIFHTHKHTHAHAHGKSARTHACTCVYGYAYVKGIYLLWELTVDMYKSMRWVFFLNWELNFHHCGIWVSYFFMSGDWRWLDAHFILGAPLACFHILWQILCVGVTCLCTQGCFGHIYIYIYHQYILSLFGCGVLCSFPKQYKNWK